MSKRFYEKHSCICCEIPQTVTLLCVTLLPAPSYLEMVAKIEPVCCFKITNEEPHIRPLIIFQTEKTRHLMIQLSDMICDELRDRPTHASSLDLCVCVNVSLFKFLNEMEMSAGGGLLLTQWDASPSLMSRFWESRGCHSDAP